MQKFASKPVKEAAHMAQGSASARLHTNTELQFVYDVCNVCTSFVCLRYVLDAKRPPLGDLDEAAFRNAYGIDRCLTFKRGTRRARVPTDWFGMVYA